MPPVLPFRRTQTAASNFENILRPHVEYLYRLAWRFTGNVADAEDLVQDLLLKLYPRAQGLAGIEQLRPWLARVLYHQYVDLLRQRARSLIADPATDADGDLFDELPAIQDGPEEQAERGSTQMNEVLNRSVEELELSVRSYNCLKNANIQTIGDLVQRSEAEMLRTKNFGRKSLNEIKEILQSLSLGFGMKPDSTGRLVLPPGGSSASGDGF